MYIHTGGTTATPRMTQISHDTLIYKNWAYREVMGYTEDEVHWCAGPMFHIGSVVNQGLGALALGVTLVNPGPWGFRNKQVIRNYWRLVEKFRITRLSGQPTVLSALVNVPVDGADLSSLRKLATTMGSSNSPRPPAASSRADSSQRLATS